MNNRSIFQTEMVDASNKTTALLPDLKALNLNLALRILLIHCILSSLCFIQVANTNS